MVGQIFPEIWDFVNPIIFSAIWFDGHFVWFPNFPFQLGQVIKNGKLNLNFMQHMNSMLYSDEVLLNICVLNEGFWFVVFKPRCKKSYGASDGIFLFFSLHLCKILGFAHFCVFSPVFSRFGAFLIFLHDFIRLNFLSVLFFQLFATLLISDVFFFA